MQKITGGQGKILGAVLGVIIIYLLNTTLIMIGLSASWNNLFVGTILVISVAVTSLQERNKEPKELNFYRIGGQSEWRRFVKI